MKTATILTVDDDRGFRDVLRDLLNQDPDFQLIGEAEKNKQDPVSVFLVDDDANFLSFAADYLSAQTAIVVTGCAHGGREGIAKTCSLKPDVVLVDLEMPDLPGLEVISVLRRNRPQLGIIAFTFLDLTRYRKWAL